MNYQTSNEIELAVIGEIYGIRKYISVPNVSWGLFPYEMDLCIVSHTTHYGYEVEIKVSKADLKRDMYKIQPHQRNRNMIRELWFAMPDKIRGNEEFVPETAGIMYISKSGCVSIFRKPTVNKSARKWGESEIAKLGRLGTMRYWNIRKVVKSGKMP